jgi:hypothetical protein
MSSPSRAAVAILVFATVLPASARADQVPGNASAGELPTPKAQGVKEPAEYAVVVPHRTSSTDVLVRELYARPNLRPANLTETQAKRLAGLTDDDGPGFVAPFGAPSSKATSPSPRDVTGDDAASRAVLDALLANAQVQGAFVVFTDEEGGLFVRVYHARKHAFDANVLRADRASEAPWRKAIDDLEATYGRAAEPEHDADAARQARAKSIAEKRARALAPGAGGFLSSPWFWGAMGAALLGGGAIYFSTRDREPGTIQLQVRVPQ